jgi:hypothetical protein
MPATATSAKTLKHPNLAGRFQGVSIAKIQMAPWNPSNRVEQRRLQRLRDSIEDIGLIYPVLCTPDYKLIDGHRRLTVVKELGWETVPAFIIAGEYEHTYGTVNSTHARLSGNDILGVYLANPHALILDHRRKVENIERMCGRQSISLLYRAGASFWAFDLARRVFRYINHQAEIRVILTWVLEHQQWGLLRHGLYTGLDPKTLQLAIAANRPITIGNMQ